MISSFSSSCRSIVVRNLNLRLKDLAACTTPGPCFFSAEMKSTLVSLWRMRPAYLRCLNLITRVGFPAPDAGTALKVLLLLSTLLRRCRCSLESRLSDNGDLQLSTAATAEFRVVDDLSYKSLPSAKDGKTTGEPSLAINPDASMRS